MALSKEKLIQLHKDIEKIALDYDLTFDPVIFKICDYDTINMLASRGGFPKRYPHWSFGMSYDRQYKTYKHGLGVIYEMVINTNPCYAYLLDSNEELIQKMVIAHVFGHADFFKNNYWFTLTDKNMMNVMANHAIKIKRYSDRYGVDRVEEFIDIISSLDNLIDKKYLFKTNKNKQKVDDSKKEESLISHSSSVKSYMINKKMRQSKSIVEEESLSEKIVEKFDSRKDVLLFLMKNAPLELWQQDIIDMLRKEALYYLPQGMTKIMNEGWATLFHSRMLTEKILDSSEIVDFANIHAGVTAMGQSLNPYKLGLEIWRDLIVRYNKGWHGKAYNECSNIEAKKDWDTKAGKGLEKIFQVRKTHNDVTFIDDFFTKEFCERNKMFVTHYNQIGGNYIIDDETFNNIKTGLLGQLENAGSPDIRIETANHFNSSELYLKHYHVGHDLKVSEAEGTIKNIYKIWKRTVHLELEVDGDKGIISFNGDNIVRTGLGE